MRASSPPGDRDRKGMMLEAELERCVRDALSEQEIEIGKDETR